MKGKDINLKPLYSMPQIVCVAASQIRADSLYFYSYLILGTPAP